MLPLEPRPTVRPDPRSDPLPAPPTKRRLALVQPTPLTRAAQPVESVPRNCVMCLPTLSPDVTELIGFDATGTVRYRVQMDVSEDAEFWRFAILARMARRYPAPATTGDISLVGD